jgi:hypothetical protein
MPFMKATFYDLFFIILAAAILLFLSETDQLDVLIRLPFVTIGCTYAIGRLSGELGRRRANKQKA